MFSDAMAFRKANLEAFQKKYGIKFGYMSIFTKACAYALQDQPVVNAVIEDAVSINFNIINFFCDISKVYYKSKVYVFKYYNNNYFCIIKFL